MKPYLRTRKIPVQLIVLLLLTLLFFSSRSYAQTILANTQTNSITGLCLLCSINNPDNAVDTSLTSYSEFTVPVQLLGTKLSQTLIFPAATTAGCDSLIIKTGSRYALSSSSFSTITIHTYNGTVANNDSLSPSGAQLRLLPDNTQAEIRLLPGQAFDRVTVTYNVGIAGLLGSFRIYYALRKPGIPAPTTIPARDTTICQGNNVKIVPLRVPNTIYSWYDAPAGGNSIHSDPGDYSITVTPAATTTYYAAAETGGCISARSPVKVIVNPRPANPVYTLPLGNSCTDIFTAVSNYQAGINYNVQVKYAVFGSLVLDTAYIIKGSGNIPIKDYNNNFSKQADVYIQAIDSITRCVSDTVHKTFVFGGTGFYPSTDADSVTICKYDSVTLHAFVPSSTIPPILWYSAATGGNLLFTGPYYKVSPPVTTTYYVTSKTLCDYPFRRPVKVIVNKLPDPDYTVTGAIVCGPQQFPVLNHRNGLNYKVRIIFTQLIPSGSVLDTSFIVLNNGIITTPDYISYSPATADIYIQAVDAITGCRSDTVHTIYNIGGYAKFPNTDADSISICRGDTIALHAFIPGTSLPMIRWYNVPTGGTRLYSGNYFRVSPVATTTYYVTAGYECEFPQRRPVKVIVTSCTKQAITITATTHPVTETTLKKLYISPNPTTGEVRFNADIDLTGSLAIVKDVNGRILQQEILIRNGLNIKQTKSGIYFLQVITTKNGTYTGKIVISSKEQVIFSLFLTTYYLFSVTCRYE